MRNVLLMSVSLFPCLDTPIVKLQMGSSLNPDDIKEGDDIYFDCHIQSNPKPYKLAWYHNVSMAAVVSAGILGL